MRAGRGDDGDDSEGYADSSRDGHVVTYIKDDDRYMTLMNSWGPDFGDRGFFKIAGPWVLSELVPMEFFDIFWYEDDLSKQAQRSFRRLHRRM